MATFSTEAIRRLQEEWESDSARKLARELFDMLVRAGEAKDKAKDDRPDGESR